jgi:hypothetical protein
MRRKLYVATTFSRFLGIGKLFVKTKPHPLTIEDYLVLVPRSGFSDCLLRWKIDKATSHMLRFRHIGLRCRLDIAQEAGKLVTKEI